MQKKREKPMSKHDGIKYTSELQTTRAKNYRKIQISSRYWRDCGSPDVNNELFKKCLFIGYGASATRFVILGLDTKVEDIHMTAEFMGYNEGTFEIVVKE